MKPKLDFQPFLIVEVIGFSKSRGGVMITSQYFGDERNILSTPFPLLGNNLKLSGIIFFFVNLFNFNLLKSTLDNRS